MQGAHVMYRNRTSVCDNLLESVSEMAPVPSNWKTEGQGRWGIVPGVWLEKAVVALELDSVELFFQCPINDPTFITCVDLLMNTDHSF